MITHLLTDAEREALSVYRGNHDLLSDRELLDTQEILADALLRLCPEDDGSDESIHGLLKQCYDAMTGTMPHAKRKELEYKVADALGIEVERG